MPVRSLDSSIIRWPDRDQVDAAVRRLAIELAASRPDLLRVGYFGSYADGRWGVGSDVDVIIVVSGSDEPFPRRAAAFDVSSLPVPADVLVYTTDELERVSPRILDGTVWVFAR